MKKAILIFGLLFIGILLLGCIEQPNLPEEVANCQKIQKAVYKVMERPQTELQHDIDICISKEASSGNKIDLCQYIQDSTIKENCINKTSENTELIELCKNDDFSTTYETFPDRSKLIGIKNFFFTELEKNPTQYLNRISDLNCLEYFRYSISHRLNKDHIDITTFSSFKNLKNLKILYLQGTKAKNLSGLENLTKLEILDLQYNYLEDISSISNLKNLKELNLSDNLFGNMDLSNLENLTNLEKLSLISSTPTTNLSALEKLSNLKELNISVISFDNLEPIKKLNNLEILNIINLTDEDCQSIKDALPKTTITCNYQ